jgi:hypothetical protein
LLIVYKHVCTGCIHGSLNKSGDSIADISTDDCRKENPDDIIPKYIKKLRKIEIKFIPLGSR